jgi:hypothetical protein
MSAQFLDADQRVHIDCSAHTVCLLGNCGEIRWDLQNRALAAGAAILAATRYGLRALTLDLTSFFPRAQTEANAKIQKLRLHQWRSGGDSPVQGDRFQLPCLIPLRATRAHSCAPGGQHTNR